MAHLLQVEGLETRFKTDRGDLPYLDDISFYLDAGEILGIVGESGSGKSVTSLSIMGLLDESGRVSQGQILFNGTKLLELDEHEFDKIRGNKLTMIFQDAMSSLNPVFTVGMQLMESIRVHMGLSRKEAKERAVAILRQMGLPDPEKLMKKYPHMLSGGMQQRIMIAMALSCDPMLLIADEPTTALDVTIQAQIMELIRRLRDEIGMAVLLVTHDIALIAEMADRVLVMYAGQIVEETGVENLFAHPVHPYTQALLASVPSIQDDPERVLESIKGLVPEYYQTIKGCRFYSRCPHAQPSCASEEQVLRESAFGGRVRCNLAVEGKLDGGEMPRAGGLLR